MSLVFTGHQPALKILQQNLIAFDSNTTFCFMDQAVFEAGISF